MGKINVGLIGAGRIGRIHAEVLAHRVPGANLLAVTDALPANAERCATDFQIPKVVASPAELFAGPAIQAVAICSNADTHVPFIIEAAKAGKHVFCEKPIALDLHAVDTGALWRNP
jgi:myo-inositol 2-dehydrogenase / D-chiro-inositol 1-dehydrogenase